MEISLFYHLVTCIDDTGVQFDCVVVEHLVKPEQLLKETVEPKGATQSSPNMKLPVARVKIHFTVRNDGYISNSDARSYLPCHPGM